MLYSPSNNHQKSGRSGFTLVEILAIVPIVILVIAVLVGFLVTITGDAMMVRERSSMVYTTQDALNQIEQDIRISSGFLATTGTLTSPQGSNGGTAAFSNPSEQLILTQYATVGSPNDASRSLAFYANRPNTCGNNHEYNETANSTIVYFLNGSDLHRRTIIDVSGTLCDFTTADLWQVNTCAVEPNKDRCVARDSVLASDVDNFSVSYFLQPNSLSPIVSPASTNEASTADVSITISRDVANETIEHTGSIRATRLNGSAE